MIGGDPLGSQLEGGQRFGRDLGQRRIDLGFCNLDTAAVQFQAVELFGQFKDRRVATLADIGNNRLYSFLDPGRNLLGALFNAAELFGKIGITEF